MPWRHRYAVGQGCWEKVIGTTYWLCFVCCHRYPFASLSVLVAVVPFGSCLGYLLWGHTGTR